MISVLCPTRKRPDSMKRFAKSIVETVSDFTKVELIFYVDNDDVDSRKQLEYLHNNYTAISITGVIGERILLSNMWNKCCDVAKGDIFMQGGDDVVFRTKHWDKIVEDAFKEYPDRIVFVYGRDTPADPPRRGTHGFLHDNWVQAVGYFTPPYFRTWYGDTWLNEVAQRINRIKYIKDLYTEHLHVGRKLSPMDETYLEGSQGPKDDVKKIWRETKELRVQDAEKLKQYIKGFGK